MGVFKKRGKRKQKPFSEEWIGAVKDVAGFGCSPAGTILPGGNPPTVAEITEHYPVASATLVNKWIGFDQALADRRDALTGQRIATEPASSAAVEELRRQREYLRHRLNLAHQECRPKDADELTQRLHQIEKELWNAEGPSPWNHPFGKLTEKEVAKRTEECLLASSGKVIDSAQLAKLMDKMIGSEPWMPAMPPLSQMLATPPIPDDDEEDSKMSVIQREILRVKKERLKEVKEKNPLPPPVTLMVTSPEPPKIALRVAKMPLHKLWNVLGDYDLIVQVIHRAYSKSEGDYEVAMHYFMIGGKAGIANVVPDAELLACVVFGEIKATIMDTEEKS